ncbi:MAG: tRNA dihydrouridine synthase DusB [Oscillospiraceae bacterium]|jgi:nifR3 family TIM-barrel protein|nr:tRNA dihydrouridine synthase DusB [Oscillospiraceae bacterium]
MRIGNIDLAGGLMLAPMAGMSDFPMRALCRDQGCAYAITEMVSARCVTLAPKGLPALEELLVRAPNEEKLGLQLFGFDPSDFSEAVKILEHRQFDAIDINMGCPAPKVTRSGAGSALLRDLPLAARIIREAVRASKIPVGIKMRSGWDAPDAAVPLARIAEAEGAAYITIHGRTRSDMFAGTVDIDTIAAVKASVRIPVIGNGDVRSYADAKRMRDATGCDGVMIGRAALGNPWIFSEIAAAREGRVYSPPSVELRLETALTHARAQCGWKGERRAMTEMRARLVSYMRGQPGSARWRANVQSVSSLDDLREVIEHTQNYTPEPNDS